jgi:hypothetical protein
MQAWLYQMRSRDDWGPEDFRVEVWEGKETTWPRHRVARGKKQPQPGDLLFFLFAPTGTEDPGFCGWGILTWLNNDRIRFRPLPPTDILKVDPIWNKKTEKVIDSIRGQVKQGTMWPIDQDGLKGLKRTFSARFH